VYRLRNSLPGLNNVIYKGLLEKLGIETLEMRREDLAFTYKVIFGLVSDSCNELFIMSNSSISTQGHDYINYFNATVVSTLVNISSPSELLYLEQSVCY